MLLGSEWPNGWLGGRFKCHVMILLTAHRFACCMRFNDPDLVSVVQGKAVVGLDQ